jgi:hypothetical protein
MSSFILMTTSLVVRKAVAGTMWREKCTLSVITLSMYCEGSGPTEQDATLMYD